MAVYRKELQRKRFPVLSKPAGVTQYEELAERALGNSINHLNMAYSQKLSGAEGAVELRDEGVYTYDNQGRRYLDCLGGYGIFNVGHRHPKVINAVKAQLNQVALHSQEFDQSLGLPISLASLLLLPLATCSTASLAIVDLKP